MAEQKKDWDAILKNEQEFKNLAQGWFNKVDTNKSGSIDSSELGVLLRDICENIMKLPFKVGDSDIKAFMKQYDTDRDGGISFSEFEKVARFMIDQYKMS